MVLTVFCEPLTQAGFAPFGGLISTDVVTDRTVTVNGGTARRTPEVVPTVNGYADAPSKVPARTALNVSLASPREVLPWAGREGTAVDHNDGPAAPSKRALTIKMLERHRFSTQSFVPMGAPIRYLVVVAAGDANAPNLQTLHGFVAGDKQGVCYGPGVWHAPMAVIDNPVSFAIVQHVNGVADEDCEFFHLDEEIDIVF